MKKGLRFLCVALCLALVLGCVGSAMADAFKQYIHGSKIYDCGFGVPHTDADGFYNDYYRRNYLVGCAFQGLNGQYLLYTGTLYAIGNTIYGAMCEDPEKAIEYYNTIKLIEGEKYGGDSEADIIRNMQEEIIQIDGHPAYTMRFETENREHIAKIDYARNSILLVVSLQSMNGEAITDNDLKYIASLIEYDEAAAPFVAADTEMTIAAKGDLAAVIAGKNAAFTAAFANPGRVNKKNKNDAVVWSVGKADTGEAVEGVSIDAKGQLKVDKKLAAPVDLQVKAASELFGTSATYNITAMPVVSKVILDQAELFFYTGTEDAQTVKASLEPATVPPVGLTWTAVKNGIVEITPVEDGVVSIKPLAAGKTDIAVKEPGGKNAKLIVNVVAPVESVELKANGAAKAGGKVKIAATLAPKNVGNKAVQWSLDVGEDIATINEKGQLTISKTAPSGTKITVTCMALGAPSPVVGKMVIDIP